MQTLAEPSLKAYKIQNPENVPTPADALAKSLYKYKILEMCQRLPMPKLKGYTNTKKLECANAARVLAKS